MVGAAVVAVVVLLWWSPWEDDKPKPPSNDAFTFSSSTSGCEAAYFDDLRSTWLDQEAVQQIPGCAGWLPPPPDMLPGYDQDCDDIASGLVRVGAYDRYGLDADGDGIGCELNE